MGRRFAKVSEEEIEEAVFYPYDLVNTEKTIPLRVSEERWMSTAIHLPFGEIVVYYYLYFILLLTTL